MTEGSTNMTKKKRAMQQTRLDRVSIEVSSADNFEDGTKQGRMRLNDFEECVDHGWYGTQGQEARSRKSIKPHPTDGVRIISSWILAFARMTERGARTT